MTTKILVLPLKMSYSFRSSRSMILFQNTEHFFAKYFPLRFGLIVLDRQDLIMEIESESAQWSHSHGDFANGKTRREALLAHGRKIYKLARATMKETGMSPNELYDRLDAYQKTLEALGNNDHDVPF